MSHSIIPPSSASIWGHCSGSIMLQASIPDEETEESREGEAAHWVAEQILSSFTGGPDKSSIMSVSELPDLAPNGYPIDEDMFYGAREYVNDVLKVCNQHGLLRKLNIEARVLAPRIHPESYGTVDLWVFDEKTADLYLWDFKYGHGHVEVYENLQLTNYAIGILDHLFDSNPKLTDEVITVHMKVAQPRSFHRDGPIREWVVKGSNLRALANQLHFQAHEGLSENAKYVSGDHCRYCKGVTTCDAFLRAGYNAIDVVSRLSPQQLTPAEISAELHILERAEARINVLKNAREAEAEGYIRQGTPVPGYGMQSKKGNVVWIDGKEQDVITMFELYGHDLESTVKIPTPRQCGITAASLGIDESVIKQYTTQNVGSARLVKQDEKAVAKIFKQR